MNKTNTRKKILYISDLNMGGANSADQAVPRSGYCNIAIELCRRLSKDNDVYVLGLGYTGQEHFDPFPIIPCNNLQDVIANAAALKQAVNAEYVIVAMDIHQYQESIYPLMRQIGLKYMCITPLESDPLCLSWSHLLKEMDKVFFISQFGTDEAVKAGVNAEHIEIGIDSHAWRLRTKEEYQAVRSNLGYDPEDFVILTVADNQERKNLGVGFEIVSELKKKGVSVKHILVTREHSSVGWKLTDLAYELNISSDLRVFNNGIPFADLFMLYCASDGYLSCSQGEGLGIPVMESACVGVPVVANRTGALPELLADERGWVVPYAYKYPNPFGNQNRYHINKEAAVEALLEVYNHPEKVDNAVLRAREFMETRNWDKPAQQVQAALELMDEKSAEENG